MNRSSSQVEPYHALPLSEALAADLRSDHAGETGAVAVYRGMLAVTRDASIRRFALAHIRTELRHLRFFQRWLPPEQHSRLLPIWRAAGWVLGAGSALFGRDAAFHTVAAVETFVERHYVEQIDAMRESPELTNLRHVLERFCAEEVHHRDDARQHLDRKAGRLAKLWAAIVGQGSAVGVFIARRV